MIKQEDMPVAEYPKGSEKNMEREGLSMIVPVFNEEYGIVGVLADLKDTMNSLDIPGEIIVVDDGSTDGTSIALKNIEGIKIISHRLNQGYGAAIKTGMKEACFEWIGITDADGTYPTEKIPEMAIAMSESDMIVGARTGKFVKTDTLRRPAKWILAQLANYLIGQKIPDINSGLRFFKKCIAERFLNILPDGFSFTTTITLAMMSHNYSVVFLPINYNSRLGKSKIRPFYDTMNFLILIFRTVLYFNPLKVFLPMGLLPILISLIFLVLRLIRGGGHTVIIPMFLLSGIQILALGMIADLVGRRTKV